MDACITTLRCILLQEKSHPSSMLTTFKQQLDSYWKQQGHGYAHMHSHDGFMHAGFSFFDHLLEYLQSYMWPFCKGTKGSILIDLQNALCLCNKLYTSTLYVSINLKHEGLN